LSPLEQQKVASELSPGHEQNEHAFRDALRDPKVYALALAWFTIVCGLYALTFWMPMMLRSAGIATASAIGLWGIVPYGVGAIGMLLLSRNSDRLMERRWHACFCCIFGAASLTALSFAGQHLPLTLISLSIATITLFAAMPILLSVPMATLTPKAAPGGIALINCIGLTGGFFSPVLLGWVKTATGNLNNGLYIIAGLLTIGAAIIVFVVKPQPSCS
jgi:predicted MFS family arabinose efflux permease